MARGMRGGAARSDRQGTPTPGGARELRILGGTTTPAAARGPIPSPEIRYQ